jgi:tetratricopeptide (TPR) repeat protein
MGDLRCLIALVLAGVPAGFRQVALADALVLPKAEAAFDRGLKARSNPVEAKKDFQEAAKLYEGFINDGYRNADLYRNLGNASLLAGDLPRAILAYRSGLRLAPNDRALRSNLAVARERVSYPEPGPFARPAADTRPPWLPYVPPLWRLTAAMIAYTLAWLALMRWRMMRQRRLLGAACLLGIISLLLGASLAADCWKGREESRHPLVVIADDGVLLRRGNGFKYPPRSEIPLNRGVEARLLFTRGDWLQIELASGEIGWVWAAYTLGGESADRPGPG